MSAAQERPRSVLLISTVCPVPVDNGKRAVLAGLLDYFVARLGPDDVHLAILTDPDEQLPRLPCAVHRLDRPRTAEQVLPGARRLLLQKHGTLQEALLSSPRLKRQVQALVTDLDTDLVLYDTLRMAQHRPAGTRAETSIVYMDDLFSQRYARILALDGSPDSAADIDPLGEFAANVPAALRGLVRRPFVYRRLLELERGRILERETQIAQSFAQTLLVSGAEVDLLRSRAGSDTVSVLTPRLPEVDWRPRAARLSPEFVFLGRLNIPHNDDAICNFLDVALDDVVRRCPAAVVRVIGRGPSQRLVSLAERYPGVVRLEGFVEDLDRALVEATALLAPLRFGSGIKIKVLDALARGVPVVATEVAVEGIPVRRDGSDGCSVDDDFDRWPDLLARLSEPATNRQMSAAAVQFFDGVYSRRVVDAEYDRVFGLSPVRNA